MKLLGFELGNIDLEIGGEVYDLHNNFIFRGFSYDVATRELVLRWALFSRFNCGEDLNLRPLGYGSLTV